MKEHGIALFHGESDSFVVIVTKDSMVCFVDPTLKRNRICHYCKLFMNNTQFKREILDLIFNFLSREIKCSSPPTWDNRVDEVGLYGCQVKPPGNHCRHLFAPLQSTLRRYDLQDGMENNTSLGARDGAMLDFLHLAACWWAWCALPWCLARWKRSRNPTAENGVPFKLKNLSHYAKLCKRFLIQEWKVRPRSRTYGKSLEERKGIRMRICK